MCHHWRTFQVKESVIPDKLSLRACWLFFIINKGRTIRKVRGGGGELSSRRNFFSLSNSLYDFFLGHSMNFFFFGGGGGG